MSIGSHTNATQDRLPTSEISTVNKTILSTRDSSNYDYLMILCLLIMGIISILHGEIIPQNDGLGYDGSIYADITKNPPDHVFHSKLNSYQFQRILPPTLIHYTFTLIGVPLENTNIIKGFQLYSLILLLTTVYLWILIANELRIGAKGKWLGFSGLYMNFAILKFPFYYPVTTDTSAFTLGILLLYCFLKDKRTALLFMTVLGAFTWPTMIYYGSVLYLFPRKLDSPYPPRDLLGLILASSITGIVLLGIVYFYFIEHLRLPGSARPVVESVVYVSIMISLAYIFFSLSPLLNYRALYNNINLHNIINAKRVVIILTVFISIRIVVFAMSNPGGTPSVFSNTLISAIQRPFIFGISHVIYYGPIILLTYFFWDRICEIVHRYGIGLTMFALINVILSLNSESRALIASLPFVVAFTTKAMDDVNVKALYYWCFGILSVLYSKWWLNINDNVLLDISNISWRSVYYMNYGPWMHNLAFITQGAVVGITGIVMYTFLRKQASRDTCKLLAQ